MPIVQLAPFSFRRRYSHRPLTLAYTRAYLSVSLFPFLSPLSSRIHHIHYGFIHTYTAYLPTYIHVYAIQTQITVQFVFVPFPPPISLFIFFYPSRNLKFWRYAMRTYSQIIHTYTTAPYLPIQIVYTVYALYVVVHSLSYCRFDQRQSTREKTYTHCDYNFETIIVVTRHRNRTVAAFSLDSTILQYIKKLFPFQRNFRYSLKTLTIIKKTLYYCVFYIIIDFQKLTLLHVIQVIVQTGSHVLDCIFMGICVLE